MIVQKTPHYEEDGKTVSYIECIFDSSNILMSIYFPSTEVLYISFNRGGTYKYTHVSKEKYENFENAESQGKFFVKEIKNNSNHPYSKEFVLFEQEITEAKNIIKEWKENQESKNS